MVRAWYPPGVRTAAERLRYYAAHFDTVEVDSTFYALPNSGTARLWAERTPPGFVFHVKAFGLLTRHPVAADRLPAQLRASHRLETDPRGRVLHPPPELREEAFALFTKALAPLRSQGKLGVILMQFPPYFVANDANREYIAYSTGLLAPDRVAVEFRHASWVEPANIESTLDLLSSMQASFVCVDEPRINSPTVLPPISAVTADPAYVRFHGRNERTWNARVSSAAERFKYLYSLEELAEWVEPVRRLQEEASAVYLMFNNCYADYAPRNARQMMLLLRQEPMADFDQEDR